MVDLTVRPDDARKGSRVLLAASLLFLALGCGGEDSPAAPSFDTLVVSSTPLPNAVATVLYSGMLTASGGDGNYVWSVAAGSLPTGLALDPLTGGISGTPSVVEVRDFTVEVASGDGQTARRALSVTVDALVLQPSELCSDHADDAIATFEDANLKAAVRASLSIGAEEALTCGLLSGLTVLSASDQGIQSVAGIQNATSLTVARLWDNSITDLSALSELTSLTSLVLFGNSVTDIGPLSGLTSLTDLSLRENSITDISALSGLTSLTQLALSSNAIADIGALSELTSLTDLELHSNAITDIDALSELTSLTRLSLGRNSITDIGALDRLTSLNSLSIFENSIADISALTGLTSLTELDLSTNSVIDISALSDLAGVIVLGLSGNEIIDISALSGLTSLTQLDLRSNPISDIQPLLDNPGLGTGDTVDVRLTMVSCGDVAALQAKGVTVTSTCP